MTVTTEDLNGEPVVISGPYLGNGVTAVFDYGFPINAATELEVVRQNANLSEDVLVLGVDYSVAGVGNDAGGQITIITPAVRLPTGAKLVIRYNSDFNQSTAYSNQGAIQLDVLEASLDKLTMTLRQLREVTRRAVTIDSFGTASVETLQANLATVAAVDAEIAQLAPVAADIETVAANVADIVAAADALNAGASPFTDAVEIVGDTPKLDLRETTGAPTGAERVSIRTTNGVFAAQVRSAADALVQSFLEASFNNTGATEQRFRIGGTNRLTVNAVGAVVNGLLDARTRQSREPVYVGTVHAITRANNIFREGLYYCDSTDVDNPVASAGRAVYLYHLPQIEVGAAPGWAMQIAFDDNMILSQIFYRTRQGAGFSAWRPMWGYEQTAFIPTLSGTQFEFTSIPIGVPSFRVLYDNIGLSAPALLTLQLRTSPGGVVTTNYAGGRSVAAGAASFNGSESTSGIALLTDGASGARTFRGKTTCHRYAAGAVWAIDTTGHRLSDNGHVVQSGAVFGLTNPVAGVRLSVSTGAFNGGGFYVEWGD